MTNFFFFIFLFAKPKCAAGMHGDERTGVWQAGMNGYRAFFSDERIRIGIELCVYISLGRGRWVVRHVRVRPAVCAGAHADHV